MKHFPLTPLCPVCGGADFIRDARYPDERYCAAHTLRMRPFDWSCWEMLFDEVSHMRTCAAICRVLRIRPVISGPGVPGDQMDLYDAMVRVVAANDALRGGLAVCAGGAGAGGPDPVPETEPEAEICVSLFPEKTPESP